MFSYYGAKTNFIDLYPRPKHDLIIEPFAGSARYALKYFEKDVLLVDKYPVIIGVWKWLQNCSPADVLKLPRFLNAGASLNEIDFDCKEQKDFYGFIVGCGAERPRLTAPKRKTTDRPNHINYNLKRVADNLYKIKHWKFSCSDFNDIRNISATWFIDPPYQFGGKSYVISNKNINYFQLSDWCLSRKGQIIVCENSKADWMDFVPVATCHGSLFKTTEVMYTNEYTHFHNVQQKLIF